MNPLYKSLTMIRIVDNEETFSPPAGVRAAARRAIKFKEAGKASGAGTAVGWTRASQLANGEKISLSTVKRMYSYFSRHEVDKKGKDWGNQSNPSNGYIMWLAWGGDAGKAWASKIVKSANKPTANQLLALNGGPGSGNHGHCGRKGVQGGSGTCVGKVSGYSAKVAEAIQSSGIAADNIRQLYGSDPEELSYALEDLLGDDFQDRVLKPEEIEELKQYFREKSLKAAKAKGIEFPIQTYRGESERDTQETISVTREKRIAEFHKGQQVQERNQPRRLHEQTVEEADVLFWSGMSVGTYEEDEWIVKRKPGRSVQNEEGMEQFVINAVNTKLIRHEELEDKQYLVLPMVMITHGVHKGSNGPLYYPETELNKTPSIWNGRPIVVYHPKKNGQGISAGDPHVFNTAKIGIVMNTIYKDGKLKAEAWIDPVKADKVDKRIMQAIRNGDKIEISTGVFVDQISNNGKYGDKPYNSVAINYRPDHLAVLPDTKGACSISDGCGLLANESSELITHGGEGSGNHGHCGRKGQQGGSGPCGGGASAVPKGYKKPATVYEVQQDLEKFLRKSIKENFKIGQFSPGDKNLWVEFPSAELADQYSDEVDSVAKSMGVRVNTSVSSDMSSKSEEARDREQRQKRQQAISRRQRGITRNDLAVLNQASTIAGGEPSENRCWEGYEPVPGKDPYSEGSCRKKSVKNTKCEDDMGDCGCGCKGAGTCGEGEGIMKLNELIQLNELADVTPEKACKILKDGTVHGQELTDKQRKMFGYICGQRDKPTKNSLLQLNSLILHGGEGSGNHGHCGRKGQQGGSGPCSGGGSAKPTKAKASGDNEPSLPSMYKHLSGMQVKKARFMPGGFEVTRKGASVTLDPRSPRYAHLRGKTGTIARQEDRYSDMISVEVEGKEYSMDPNDLYLPKKVAVDKTARKSPKTAKVSSGTVQVVKPGTNVPDKGDYFEFFAGSRKAVGYKFRNKKEFEKANQETPEGDALLNRIIKKVESKTGKKLKRDPRTTLPSFTWYRDGEEMGAG